MIKTSWATFLPLVEKEYFIITQEIYQLEKELLALPGIIKWKIMGAYDSLWWSRRIEYPWSLFAIDIQESDSILDAGCGRTFFPVYMATMANKVAGVDLDPLAIEMYSFLKDNACSQVTCDLGDITNLHYPDNTFDKVTCISVIEHINPRMVKQAMLELCRVASQRVAITMDVVLEESNSGHLNLDQLNKMGEHLGFRVPKLPSDILTKTFHNDKVAVFLMEISV